MNNDEWNEQTNRLWDSLLGESNCATYDASVDLDVLNVATLARRPDPKFYTEIAKELNLTPQYVQLIQYLLCGKNLAEYGTSPRGCWLTEEGELWLDSFDELHSYYLSPNAGEAE